MTLPDNHPQRLTLNDEVHARPPESISSPRSITYLALFGGSQHGEDLRAVTELATNANARVPSPDSSHYSEDFGAYRIKWERHTEFSRIKIIAPLPEGQPFEKTAIDHLPTEWVANLPGTILVASHVLLLPEPKKGFDHDALSREAFGGNFLIGSEIGGGAATTFTDFRVHGDGYSRVVVYDRNLKPRQAGRMIQRIVEIDTYRMLALLAFPVARGLAPKLSVQERELAQIANAMTSDSSVEEPKLLDRLTRLQAQIESGHADTDYRFGAARAYYDLVGRRIEELRESRLEGLQTFKEFTERRLMPAIQTCNAIATRQEELSRRVARATQLLSTRVAVARERQNQDVLAAMARRAKLQLRLQQTVEGLSVAAVTYYVVGLVGYASKALAEAGLPVSPPIMMGLAIPVVAGFIWWGVRRARAAISRDEGDENGDRLVD
ncbi:MAG: DUF3422 domain-containing protein [Pseudomonadota bacterium]